MVNYPSMNPSTSQSRVEVVNAFMRGVYGWMGSGLAITAVLAYLTAHSSLGIMLLQKPMLMIVLIVAQFGLVIALSAAIRKLSAGAATGMFVIYSALTGVTLSSIFFVYSIGSIFSTFVVTAGMFGAMSIYGLMTKKDLTSWGSFLFMGLIGIVLAMLVNMFIGSSTMSFVISGLGVLIFTGLTAYDTQKLKVMGESVPQNDSSAVRKGTILGALTLYLDFINLFLMLLRFMGAARD